MSSYPTLSPEANPGFWHRSVVQGRSRKHMVWSHFTQEERTRRQWGEQQCPAERCMVVQQEETLWRQHPGLQRHMVRKRGTRGRDPSQGDARIKAKVSSQFLNPWYRGFGNKSHPICSAFRLPRLYIHWPVCVQGWDTWNWSSTHIRHSSLALLQPPRASYQFPTPGKTL